MDTPLVSIIIPYFNKKNTIERAVNSVIYQTYKNWELINQNPVMIDYIKELDNNDDAYYSVLKASPISIRNKWFNVDNFLNWFDDYVVMK